MSLVDSAAKIADRITKKLGLQAAVTHYALDSSSGSGKRVYQTAAALQAVVVKKQRLVKNADGQLVMSQAYIAFLSPVTLGLFDKLVLADGTTGLIINTEAFVTAAGTTPILEVYLG